MDGSSTSFKGGRSGQTSPFLLSPSPLLNSTPYPTPTPPALTMASKLPPAKSRHSPSRLLRRLGGDADASLDTITALFSSDELRALLTRLGLQRTARSQSSKLGLAAAVQELLRSGRAQVPQPSPAESEFAVAAANPLAHSLGAYAPVIDWGGSMSMPEHQPAGIEWTDASLDDLDSPPASALVTPHGLSTETRLTARPVYGVPPPLDASEGSQQGSFGASALHRKEPVVASHRDVPAARGLQTSPHRPRRVGQAPWGTQPAASAAAPASVLRPALPATSRGGPSAHQLRRDFEPALDLDRPYVDARARAALVCLTDSESSSGSCCGSTAAPLPPPEADALTGRCLLPPYQALDVLHMRLALRGGAVLIPVNPAAVEPPEAEPRGAKRKRGAESAFAQLATAENSDAPTAASTAAEPTPLEPASPPAAWSPTTAVAGKGGVRRRNPAPKPRARASDACAGYAPDAESMLRPALLCTPPAVLDAEPEDPPRPCSAPEILAPLLEPASQPTAYTVGSLTAPSAQQHVWPAGAGESAASGEDARDVASPHIDAECSPDDSILRGRSRGRSLGPATPRRTQSAETTPWLDSPPPVGGACVAGAADYTPPSSGGSEYSSAALAVDAWEEPEPAEGVGDAQRGQDAGALGLHKPQTSYDCYPASQVDAHVSSPAPWPSPAPAVDSSQALPAQAYSPAPTSAAARPSSEPPKCSQPAASASLQQTLGPLVALHGPAAPAFVPPASLSRLDLTANPARPAAAPLRLLATATASSGAVGVAAVRQGRLAAAAMAARFGHGRR